MRHTRIGEQREEVSPVSDVAVHAPADVQAAWDVVEHLYLHNPGVPKVAGARAAAEWTTGRAAMSPISNIREAPTGDRLGWEGHQAGMVAMGFEPGDRAFATGVMEWMFWWTGLEPLPAWIRVHL